MSGRSRADIAALLDVDKQSLRTDVLVIGNSPQTPATNPVGVLEVKGAWNGGATAAATSAATYVAALHLAGWAATTAWNLTGYVDTFRVAYRCQDRLIYRDFAVTGMPLGAVLVKEAASEACETERKRIPEKNIRDVDIPEQDKIPAPDAHVDDSSIRDALASVPGAAAAAAAAGGADAAARYLAERAAARALAQGIEDYVKKTAAEQAAARAAAAAQAFDTARDEICLGPVNAATRGPGDGSVSAAALECLQLTRPVQLVLLLDDLNIALPADQVVTWGPGRDDDPHAPGSTTSPGMVRADPRLATLDGLNYDFHGVGEYVLLDHRASGLQVQMRTVPAQNDMSSVGAMTVSSGGTVVQLEADGTVLTNGETFGLLEGELADLGDGILISRYGGVISLLSAFDDAGEQAVISWTPQPGDRGDFSIAVPRSWAGQLTGMLGNLDGDPRNDLVSAQGVDVTGSLKFGAASSVYAQRLYATFGDSWRVTEDSTHFTYPSGKTTADHTDRSRPLGAVSLADLSDAALTNARAVCEAAGITDGLSLTDCLLDVGFSGDPSFAKSLATRDTFGISAEDAVLGDTPLTVAFNGTVPANFFPGRIRSLGSGANYAGPFSGDNGYSFYVNELPGHRALKVSATVLVPADADTDALDLVVDGQPYPAVSEAPAAVTMADGSPGLLVPVTFTVPHAVRQVQATILSRSTWFGVSSITVDADRVPYQQFDVTLSKGTTFDPSIDLHDNGAGLIEEAGAADRYCFTVAGPTDLMIDLDDAPTGLQWRLWSTTGGFVDHEGVASRATTVAGVDGASCLEVTAGSSTEENLEYRLNLVLVPDAQSFETPLAAGAATITDGKINGVLTAGAGHLETVASRDVYRFTIPDDGLRLYELKLTVPAATWSLTGPGQPIGRTMQDSDQWEGALDPGQYELVVQSAERFAGPYDLQLASFSSTVTLSTASVVSSAAPVKATISWNRDLTGTRYAAELVDANENTIGGARDGTTAVIDIDVDNVSNAEQRHYVVRITDIYSGDVIDVSPGAALQVQPMSFEPAVSLSTASTVSSATPVKATISWNRDLTGTRYAAELVDANENTIGGARDGTTAVIDIDVDNVSKAEQRQYVVRITDIYSGDVIDRSAPVLLEVKPMSFRPTVTLPTATVVSSATPIRATLRWVRNLTGTRYAASLVDADGLAVGAEVRSGTSATISINVDNVSTMQQRQYTVRITDIYTGEVVDQSPTVSLEVQPMSFTPTVSLSSATVVSSATTVKATIAWNRNLTGTQYAASLVDAEGIIVGTEKRSGTSAIISINVDNVSTMQQRQYTVRITDIYTGEVVDQSAAVSLEVQPMSFKPTVTLSATSVVSSTTPVKATIAWNRNLSGTQYAASLVDADGIIVGTEKRTGTSAIISINVDKVTTLQRRQYHLQLTDIYSGAIVDTSAVAPLEVRPK